MVELKEGKVSFRPRHWTSRDEVRLFMRCVWSGGMKPTGRAQQSMGALEVEL